MEVRIMQHLFLLPHAIMHASECKFNARNCYEHVRTSKGKKMQASWSKMISHVLRHQLAQW